MTTNILVTAELPEVEKGNVKVTVNHGVLSIQGERTMERKENGEKYHRVERAYGRFSRSFTLPDYVDGNRIAAEFKEGILRCMTRKAPKLAQCAPFITRKAPFMYRQWRAPRVEEPRLLIGVRGISWYCRISPSTWYGRLNKHDFPASRLPGGR